MTNSEKEGTPDDLTEGEGVTIEDATRLLMVSRRTIYNWIKDGRLKIAERGGVGRGNVTLLDRTDVDRESLRRQHEIETKLRQAKGERDAVP